MSDPNQKLFKAERDRRAMRVFENEQKPKRKKAETLEEKQEETHTNANATAAHCGKAVRAEETEKNGQGFLLELPRQVCDGSGRVFGAHWALDLHETRARKEALNILKMV